MPTPADIFEEFNGVLCVLGGWLYKKEVAILTKANYKNLIHRYYLKQVRRACKNTPALIEWRSIPEHLKIKIKEKAGFDPEQIDKKSELLKAIQPDVDAAAFFANYKFNDGIHKPKQIPEERRAEYQANAEILNAVITIVHDRTMRLRKLGNSTKNVWFYVSQMVNELDRTQYPHTLPANERRLQDRAKQFQREGYLSLIHKNFQNNNAEKIQDGAMADWIMAYYCLPNKPTVTMLMEAYSYVRAEQGWPVIKEETTILKFLNAPIRKRIWTLARHGKEAYKKDYGHTLNRSKVNWFPNCYWAIDGTKLDLFHYDESSSNKRATKLRVNISFDMYSEKIIGWSLSETEDHTDHFKAIKMSVKTTGVRPYLLTYDQQSGHKSKKMQDFYTKLMASGGTHYPHRAYEHGSPVEQLLNRLQQQIITKLWFSDGQSPLVRNLDHYYNEEFIEENAHLLPKKEDVLKYWNYIVEEWNNGKHPTANKTRNEVAMEEMPVSDKIKIEDMISLFHIEESKPKKYYAFGIPLTVGKSERIYEVYDGDGNIDIDFRKEYVGAKVIVKYSPDDLDEYIGLYDLQGGFIAYAEPKRTHEVVPALMLEGDKEAWLRDYKIRDEELERDKKEMERLQRVTGLTPQRMIEEQEWKVRNGRLPKQERNELEASYLNDL